jgi:hypothetical protein
MAYIYQSPQYNGISFPFCSDGILADFDFKKGIEIFPPIT